MIVGGGGILHASAAPSQGSGSVLVPVVPIRVLDTRGQTGAIHPLGTQDTFRLSLAASVPLEATAIAANITVVGGSAASFLTVFPSGSPQPNASNINWKDSGAVANQLTATIGASRSVDIFNSVGRVDVIIDLAGYYMPASAAGSTGTPGPKGDTGVNGDTGATGLAGPAGPAGPAGAAGAAGPAGEAGPAGAPGVPGPVGAKGATGAAGVNGVAVLIQGTLASPVTSLPDGGLNWPLPSASSSALNLGSSTVANGYYIASMNTVRSIDLHEPVACWISDGTAITGGLYSGSWQQSYVTEPDHQDLQREVIAPTVIHVINGTVQVRCARQDDADPSTSPLLTSAELNLIPVTAVVAP